MRSVCGVLLTPVTHLLLTTSSRQKEISIRRATANFMLFFLLLDILNYRVCLSNLQCWAVFSRRRRAHRFLRKTMLASWWRLLEAGHDSATPILLDAVRTKSLEFLNSVACFRGLGLFSLRSVSIHHTCSKPHLSSHLVVISVQLVKALQRLPAVDFGSGPFVLGLSRILKHDECRLEHSSL